jgi:hypothetical protein
MQERQSLGQRQFRDNCPGAAVADDPAAVAGPFSFGADGIRGFHANDLPVRRATHDRVRPRSRTRSQPRRRCGLHRDLLNCRNLRAHRRAKLRRPKARIRLG